MIEKINTLVCKFTAMKNVWNITSAIKILSLLQVTNISILRLYSRHLLQYLAVADSRLVWSKWENLRQNSSKSDPPIFPFRLVKIFFFRLL